MGKFSELAIKLDEGSVSKMNKEERDYLCLCHAWEARERKIEKAFLITMAVLLAIIVIREIVNLIWRV